MIQPPLPAVLVGCGSNKLRVICMVFPSYEHGVEWLRKSFGWRLEPLSPVSDPDDGACTVICRDLRLATVVHADKKPVDFDVMQEEYDTYYNTAKKPHEGRRKFRAEIMLRLFVTYYDGCGACYGLQLREVPYGVPLVSFDLD